MKEEQKKPAMSGKARLEKLRRDRAGKGQKRREYYLTDFEHKELHAYLRFIRKPE